MDYTKFHFVVETDNILKNMPNENETIKTDLYIDAKNLFWAKQKLKLFGREKKINYKIVSWRKVDTSGVLHLSQK